VRPHSNNARTGRHHFANGWAGTPSPSDLSRPWRGSQPHAGRAKAMARVERPGDIALNVGATKANACNGGHTCHGARAAEMAQAVAQKETIPSGSRSVPLAFPSSPRAILLLSPKYLYTSGQRELKRLLRNLGICATRTGHD
jgi:hypothetical protein